MASMVFSENSEKYAIQQKQNS